MTKEEYLEQIKRILFGASEELSEDDYRDLADSVAAECEEIIGNIDDPDNEEGNYEDTEREG